MYKTISSFYKTLLHTIAYSFLSFIISDHMASDPMDSIDDVLALATIQHINSSQDPTATHQLQPYEMILSVVKPLALKAAVLLKILDIIATRGNEGPVSVEHIAFHIAVANSSSTSNSPCGCEIPPQNYEVPCFLWRFY